MTKEERGFFLALLIPAIVLLLTALVGCGQRAVVSPTTPQVSSEIATPSSEVQPAPDSDSDSDSILDQSDWDEVEWARCAWEFVHVNTCYPKHYWDSSTV